MDDLANYFFRLFRSQGMSYLRAIRSSYGYPLIEALITARGFIFSVVPFSLASAYCWRQCIIGGVHFDCLVDFSSFLIKQSSKTKNRNA